jgi:hypothetical protein
MANVHPIYSLAELDAYLMSGKKTIIKVGTTRCPGCKATEKPYEKVAERFSSGYNFLSVTLDAPDVQADIRGHPTLSGISSVPVFLSTRNGLVEKRTQKFNDIVQWFQ